MNTSHPYWAPDLNFEQIKTKPFLDKSLGFYTDIPWPLPVTMGAYFGEGAIPGRKELSYGSFHNSEYFAIDGIVPSTGSVPLVNIYAPHFKYSRSAVTYKV